MSRRFSTRDRFKENIEHDVLCVAVVLRVGPWELSVFNTKRLDIASISSLKTAFLTAKINF
jgi:hypothetical protein